MSKDAKNLSRIGALARIVRARRNEAGLIAGAIHGRRGARESLLEALTTSRAAVGVLMVLLFAIAASGIAIITRETPLVAVGRIMDETRLVRVPVELEDRTRTQQARESARMATPRVYRADVPVLEEVERSLESLPQIIAASPTLEEVPEKVRVQFGLDALGYEALKNEATDGQAKSAWVAKVRTFANLLRTRPLVDRETYQLRAQEGTSSTVTLLVGEERLSPVHRGEVLNAEDATMLTPAMTMLSRDAGFVGAARQVVINRMVTAPKPTYRYDAGEVARAQLEAAREVGPVVSVSTPGQIIYQRGERLTLAQSDVHRAELAAYVSGEGGNQPIIRRFGMFLAAVGVTAALAGYVAIFCPRISSSPSRLVGISAIVLGALAAACIGTIWAPSLAAVTITAPSILVAILTCIAYDRRSALAFALLQGLLACVATRAGLGEMIVIVTGVACVVSTLREIRDRTSLVKSSLLASLGAGLATVVVGLIDRPLVDGIMAEIAQDAVVTGLGVMSLGALTLLLLPAIERACNVTTGLSLLDLRDPKQPLLREMQLRAPGTYNHSLSVAAIAESAAEAVGADALLTYVGALYHDIGKMNKPEYFVENQFGGTNKHDKLSPAMSLMVVVGHVKDGMELARDFNLPRSVQHFIESHHGSTLVEYFYHRAKTIAREDAYESHGGEGHHFTNAPDGDAYVPNEFDYRYPGPKPRTKEAAILMIADAVESATRTLSEPTHSRIEALVRALANKRLLDGQFDDCELTLRDLYTITDSIGRTIASMYHGRIAYPSAEEPERDAQRDAEMAVEHVVDEVVDQAVEREPVHASEPSARRADALGSDADTLRRKGVADPTTQPTIPASGSRASTLKPRA